jgi:putative ABC transport system substrate-binding protein
VPTIGWLSLLSGESADSLEPAPVENLETFRQGLAGLGYVEGQSVIIEYRSGNNTEAELREAAADLVRLPVDVIVTVGPAALAAQAATSTIPIVFARYGDPVAGGLVTSLARPGGNATGLSRMTPQLVCKRLELLGQVVPGMRRAEQADALMISGGINNRNRVRVVSLAAAKQLPAMYPDSHPVREGGLMGYGANALDQWRRAATYVDKILKGANPADLPVEQPMRFDFAINLKTAQALGLTIPQHVLLQATEVIQ